MQQKVILRLVISLLIISTLATSCKSKLEKKDVSLEEMQAGDGKHYDPVLPTADATPVYKSVNGKDFHLNIFNPEGHQPGDSAACIIFFFGGGFVNGNPPQFEEQSKYLSSKGIVAVCADYRVISRDNCTAAECIMDAKSAIRYLRVHADELGIDPGKIVMSGGSAGGALCWTNIIDNPEYTDAADDVSVSCKPDAVVMFNPVTNFEEYEFRIRKFDGAAAALNPMNHLPDACPPMIIYHGTADEMAGYRYAKEAADKLKASGNDVTFVPFEGAEHGFYQRNKNDGKYYEETLQLTENWLREKGFLLQ